MTVQSENGDVRYRMLETVRQYAAEKLAEAGETAGAHQAHRDFFLRVATERVGYWSETSTWLNRIVLDYASFRLALEAALEEGDEEAALHLAPALWYYWLWGCRREGLEWLERSLAGPARPEIPARAQALMNLASLMWLSGAGDLSRCSQLLEEAADLALRLDDGDAAARAWFFLGGWPWRGVTSPRRRG